MDKGVSWALILEECMMKTTHTRKQMFNVNSHPPVAMPIQTPHTFEKITMVTINLFNCYF